MAKVLLFSPHPDDETIGCGGTLLKHWNNKDELYVVMVTKKIIGHLGSTKSDVEETDGIIETITRRYHLNQLYQLNFVEAALDELPLIKIINSFSSIVKEVQPNIVYLPNRNDVHSDHRVIFNAAFACTKSFRYQYINTIYMYETLSETEFAPTLMENSFMPNVYVDITDQIEEKMEIMSLYKLELMSENFPRSLRAIRALAAYRGSRIGEKYAEAFMLLYEKK